MIRQNNGRWDVLLADLSLILFIIALGGLVSAPNIEAKGQQTLSVAPSQALYREVEGGPTLNEWLGDQPLDPRATLTIFVEYSPENTTRSLEQAAKMIAQARLSNVPIRTVLTAKPRDDIYASLAFDAVSATAQSGQ